MMNRSIPCSYHNVCCCTDGLDEIFRLVDVTVIHTMGNIDTFHLWYIGVQRLIEATRLYYIMCLRD